MGSIQARVADYDPAEVKKLRPRCVLGTVEGLVNFVEGWSITPDKQRNLGIVAYVGYFFRNMELVSRPVNLVYHYIQRRWGYGMLSSHQGIPQPILLYIFLRFHCFHCMFSADKWLSVRGRLVHQRVRVSPENCCFGHLSLRMLLACFRGARADKHWPNISWNMISRLGYYRKVLYILWLSLLGCVLSVCLVLVRAPRRSLGGFQRVVVLSACLSLLHSVQTTFALQSLAKCSQEAIQRKQTPFSFTIFVLSASVLARKTLHFLRGFLMYNAPVGWIGRCGWIARCGWIGGFTSVVSIDFRFLGVDYFSLSIS